MPFCPECRAEYRPGFTRCAVCECDLVESLDLARIRMTDQEMESYLSGRELTIIAQAPLDRLKKLKSLLCTHAVANMVVRESPNCSCGPGGCAPSFGLAVAAEDLPRAMAAFEGEFRDLVSTVTEDEKEKSRCDRLVDLGGSDIQCPACDTMIPAGTMECPECGLYVGVPEELLGQEEETSSSDKKD